MLSTMQELRDRRIQLCIPQATIAKQLAISATLLGYYEREDIEIPLRILRGYQQVLDDCANGKIHYEPSSRTRSSKSIIRNTNENGKSLLMLAKWRRKNGISAHKVAAYLGTTPETLEKYENLELKMPYETLDKYEEFFAEHDGENKFVEVQRQIPFSEIQYEDDDENQEVETVDENNSNAKTTFLLNMRTEQLDDIKLLASAYRMKASKLFTKIINEYLDANVEKIAFLKKQQEEFTAMFRKDN